MEVGISVQINHKYLNSGENLLLFIDEKDQYHPTKYDNNNIYKELFVLLGIVIKESDFPILYEQFNQFKKRVRPGIDPNAWEIKGARGFLNEKNKWCEKEEMIKIWIYFSELLDNLNINFSIHGVFTNKKSITEKKSGIDWEKEGIHSILRINLGFLLENVLTLRLIASNLHYDSLSIDNKLNSLNVYYDEMKSKEIEDELNNTFQYVINLNDHIRKIVKQTNVNLEFSQLGYEKNNNYSVGIQFVDMIIYAIFKFISGQDLVDLSKNTEDKLKYYNKIINSIRHKFIKNVLLPRNSTISEISSCIKIGRTIDYTFAKELEEEIVKFSWNETNLKKMIIE